MSDFFIGNFFFKGFKNLFIGTIFGLILLILLDFFHYLLMVLNRVITKKLITLLMKVLIY